VGTDKIGWALIGWTVVGAVAGLLVWRLSSPLKYVGEKVVQGVIGAQLFGWIVVIIVGPRRSILGHIAAGVGAFLMPYYARRGGSECDVSDLSAPPDSH